MKKDINCFIVLIHSNTFNDLIHFRTKYQKNEKSFPTIRIYEHDSYWRVSVILVSL